MQVKVQAKLAETVARVTTLTKIEDIKPINVTPKNTRATIMEKIMESFLSTEIMTQLHS